MLVHNELEHLIAKVAREYADEYLVLIAGGNQYWSKDHTCPIESTPEYERAARQLSRGGIH